jgi:hypothetical protein
MSLVDQDFTQQKADGAQQSYKFTMYVRLVLPLDGFVFWVNAALVSQSAQLKALLPASVQGVKNTEVWVPGSLHYRSQFEQTEDSDYVVNEVVFTAEVAIQDFTQIGPNIMFVGTIPGPDPVQLATQAIATAPDNIRIAFSRRDLFFYRAGLHHYVGNALYSTMTTQLVDSLDDLNLGNLVVSNSLPVWLAMNSYDPQYFSNFASPCVPLYPSFAIPNNLEPPYGTVHIGLDDTEALQAAPYLDTNLSHFQLAKDKVRVTLYGLTNTQALTFLDFVNQYSLDTEQIGIMNIPTVRDDKKTQAELVILAMKKVISFEVSYNQETIRTVARQYITSCIPSLILNAP